MNHSISFASLTPDDSGLVPCIVQDVDTRRVLMMAYQDEEAWEKTRETGLVHFHSRSRDTLWMKGETSGNTLAVTTLSVDCDADTVLIEAKPNGPTCHTGSVSCFGSAHVPSLGVVLDQLAGVVAGRSAADPDVSYTAKLLSDGDLAARKVLEEAGELTFAAKDTMTGSPRERVVEEAADLFYHILVLLAEQGVTQAQVAAELISRRE